MDELVEVPVAAIEAVPSLVTPRYVAFTKMVPFSLTEPAVNVTVGPVVELRIPSDDGEKDQE